ncbi:MAG: tetratricopeptide repeat protein [Anaerolineae bacterium]|nr:tetratricopeptide repeat protein [Phycisphaerae bacterium]
MAGDKSQELLARASEDFEAGRLDGARWTLQRLLTKDPRNADAIHLLALMAAREGNVQQSVDLFRKAIGIMPNVARHRYNFAVLLMSVGQSQAAIAEYRTTIQLDPTFASAHNNLGNALRAQGKLTEARDHFGEAIRYSPQHASAHSNLGTVLADLGELDQGVSEFRAAIAANPEFFRAHSNLLLNLTAYEKCDAETLFREHQSWGRQHADPIAASIAPAPSGPAKERLRIGYVSSDFRMHSVAFFIDPILAAHDRRKFEVTCYSSVRTPDAMTGLLRGRVERWRDISSLSDEQAAAMIREDRIDILVDLGGHTSDSRLLLFARKPAPIQVEYLGYPGTSGMRQMDYLITDARVAPLESDRFYPERVIRLPRTFFCYGPPDRVPDIDPLPAIANGQVRFGVFTNPIKIRPVMIENWAKILQGVPSARLTIQTQSLRDDAHRQDLLTRFVALGIEESRIDLQGSTDFREYLSTLRSTDIGLDTFPFNGHTTTCHALFVGVPTVTQAGQMHASRMGLSICESIQLGDLVATSADEYVMKAIALANDPARLSELRAGLRQRLIDAGMMDRARFTRELETVYQDLSRRP